MKLRTLGLLVAAGTLILAAAPAIAMELGEARASGIVGEKADGYVALIKDTPEAEALVSDINIRRKKEYERISAANNQPVAVVTKLAAQQIIGKLDKDSLYQNAKGDWVAK